VKLSHNWAVTAFEIYCSKKHWGVAVVFSNLMDTFNILVKISSMTSVT
jgi:hypothetical protein